MTVALSFAIALIGLTQAAPLSPIAEIGRLAFFDTSLSASGTQSCASCHDPAHAFGPPDGAAVRLSGPKGETPGFRAVPSLRYLAETPAFHFAKDEDGETPAGGFNRDGRAQTLAEQAARPLTAPHEMANATPADAVARLAKAKYVGQFQAVFGSNILNDPDRAFAALTEALEAFQREDKAFAPFSSRFDAYLRGEAQLTAQELRGLELFKDEKKGNCAACHPADWRENGAPPLFTDFTYDNIGAPRNHDIPANADPAYMDLGLCGPDRTDLKDRKELCGAFKVPSLRNTARRGVWFHNGVFHDLREVVEFYVTRDTDPARWYKHGKFDDLPSAIHDAVNTSEAPYDRKPGETPALTEAEIDDVVAFLRTLDDRN